MEYHDFDMRQGHHGITVLFCKKCGLSYYLMVNKDGDTIWVKMMFMLPDAASEIKPPGPCNIAEETRDRHKEIYQWIKDNETFGSEN